MNSRIRVLAVTAVVLMGTAAQAQACFWPFCGGYARQCCYGGWGRPVHPVAYRRGFYAGYMASNTGYSPCTSCGTAGCSSCGVTSYYGSSCCSTCYSPCGSCGVCSSCGGCGTCSSCVGGSCSGCSNCSTNYYPESSESTSTYSNSDDPTEATTVQPRDDDFGPGSRSTDSSQPNTEDEEFEAPINPAPGEPTNTTEPPMAGPLEIGPQLTWQVLPTRSRVNVETEIRTPRVARVDAATESVPNLSVLRVASFEN